MHLGTVAAFTWPEAAALLGALFSAMFLIGISMAVFVELRKTKLASAQEAHLRQLVTATSSSPRPPWTPSSGRPPTSPSCARARPQSKRSFARSTESDRRLEAVGKPRSSPRRKPARSMTIDGRGLTPSVGPAQTAQGGLVMLPPRKLARIAGPLYLLLIVAAAFALSVRSAIVEPHAAAATADNIRASASPFRVSFVVDLTANLVYLLTAMALYLLFRHVQELVAAAMVTFVTVSVAVGSLNLLNQYTALTIATSDAYTRSLGKAGADTLALLFAGMFSNGTPPTRFGMARG